MRMLRTVPILLVPHKESVIFGAGILSNLIWVKMLVGEVGLGEL